MRGLEPDVVYAVWPTGVYWLLDYLYSGIQLYVYC